MIHFNKHHHKQNGFTLIELMLAMLFISTLLLAIGGLVVQVGAVFTKGITVKSVNEAGQLISSDMQRTLNSSTGEGFAEAPTGLYRLCTGKYVYAWNPKDESINAFDPTKRKDSIRLVKFQGATARYCTNDPPESEIPSEAVELISGTDSSLFVKDIFATKHAVVNDLAQKIYKIEMTIGTSDSMVRVSGCTEPENSIDDQYCGINTFNFTARSVGAL